MMIYFTYSEVIFIFRYSTSISSYPEIGYLKRLFNATFMLYFSLKHNLVYLTLLKNVIIILLHSLFRHGQLLVFMSESKFSKLISKFFVR